jgi:hypothetical protein
VAPDGGRMATWMSFHFIPSVKSAKVASGEIGDVSTFELADRRVSERQCQG